MAESTWIKRHNPKNQTLVSALRRDLDRGEAETIALAMELDASLVILDEKEGRHAAQGFGLRIVGVLGLLLQAKEKGLIPEVGPILQVLRQKAGFYLTDSLLQSVLALANE